MNPRKLLCKLALLLLPILLYYGVFLAFEPNNFFGLRRKTPSGAVFGAIREYRKNPAGSVIIGDSRLAHLDMNLAEQVSGRRFSNLAFGGASMKELLDLLDWTLEQDPGINEVVLGLSYYTLNAAYNTDRFGVIEKSMQNPFAYLTSLSYNLQAMENLYLYLDSQPLGGGQGETADPASYIWFDYPAPGGGTVRLRSELIRYLADISAYTGRWQPNTGQFERLLKTIDACAEKGIRFVVVLPPMHPALYEYDLVARGIDTKMAPLLQALEESPALLLDYELTNRPNLREDQYFDGFHLDYRRGLPEFTVTLFTDIGGGGQGA